MANNTYIKVWRKALDNELFCLKPFDKWHAFEWLIMKARYTPKKLLIGNNIYELKQGQLIISYDKLAHEFGWSRSTVVRYMNLLKRLKMVTLVGTHHGILVTIENYTMYQVERNDSDTHYDTDSGTIVERWRNDGDIHKNKDNKDKECINKDKEYIRHKYGAYKNVLLTDEDLTKLKNEFADYEERIERLSEYMASTGKSYKSHLATIRSWARKESNGNARPDKDDKGEYEGFDFGVVL